MAFFLYSLKLRTFQLKPLFKHHNLKAQLNYFFYFLYSCLFLVDKLSHLLFFFALAFIGVHFIIFVLFEMNHPHYILITIIDLIIFNIFKFDALPLTFYEEVYLDLLKAEWMEFLNRIKCLIFFSFIVYFWLEIYFCFKLSRFLVIQIK